VPEGEPAAPEAGSEIGPGLQNRAVCGLVEWFFTTSVRELLELLLKFAVPL